MKSVWKTDEENFKSNLNQEKRGRIIVKESLTLTPESAVCSNDAQSENIVNKRTEKENICNQVLPMHLNINLAITLSQHTMLNE